MQSIKKIPETLWTHKKKSVAAGVTIVLLGRYLRNRQRDNNIRAAYARLAVEYGQQTISPERKPRRVTVLANVFADEHRVYEKFKLNALPLLNLAGMEVDIIRAEDEAQLESVAAALDKAEADALYIVGGDGTVSKALSGIYRNRTEPALPIGIFPGGCENRGLRTLVPHVFGDCNNVGRYCESAMALIEENARKVHVVKCELDDPKEEKNASDAVKPVFGLSDFNAGWFHHVELKKKKFWYWGGLKRRFAYFWEIMKHSPEPMHLKVIYEEYCQGCKKCRTMSVTPQPQWRWWHALIGSPRYAVKENSERDYSKIENKNCGERHSLDIIATDLLIDKDQFEDSSALRLRAGGSQLSRLKAVLEGWSRCSAKQIEVSPNKEFYEHNIEARAVSLSFKILPELLKKFSIFGELIEIEGDYDSKLVRMEVLPRPIDLYLPSGIRIDQNEANPF
ncbi:hypothetical protein AB6A40_003637 [Gnathostoma spinigerum]|uniref:DAGKc domain-containing protein n=1 Tax=Gnathostoma spinigerum TaxID=75299 RepID=A0ABD6EA62_9BILA